MELEKIYDPASVEARLYQEWTDKGYFEAHRDPAKKPFTIVIPPPNITGQLHMGHALDNMMQDALIRFKRMQGWAALWLPGTDHASIATEVKLIEKLASEGKTKLDLGREAYLDMAWEWKRQYAGTIVGQLKKLGSSCDWSRERFTMDEGCNRAVNTVFIKLFNEGHIYHGDRIINWCPECKTALSDAEVLYEEEAGHLWHIRYPLIVNGKPSEDEGIVVATTRPETMLGDTAVAVHPEDERYAAMVGKTLLLPLMNREIPIVADTYVEKDFGSGAVKITPAHDPNDFDVGARHNLEMLRVMADDGTMNELAGAYANLDRYAAREVIIEDLKKAGLLIKVQNHAHNVGHCYRCQTTVEPILSKQWFVRMQELAQPAIEAVRDGRTQFVPERFAKIYYNWMENIRDWCISRQLWWGHRIPVYYCQKCGFAMAALDTPKSCDACGCTDFKQDEDVLDTWFSSALWPFSTLGWPEQTADLEYFYPTDVLVTGYDIIFFWVARMIFSGLAHTGQTPFHHVLIHGLVRDSEGRKMSKSLNNGIDPLEVIEKYGADALRFSLAAGTSPGNDMRFYWEKVEAGRNFANKLWNAARFILTYLDKPLPALRDCELTLPDRWILHRLNELTRQVTENLEAYELGLSAQNLYDFIWTEYCDWFIEFSKARLQGDHEGDKAACLAVLCDVFSRLLELLHPFMPFVTEEIWQHMPPHNMPHTGETIMLTSWPTVREQYENSKASTQTEAIMELIRGIRNVRSEMGVSPSRRTQLFVIAKAEECAMYEQNASYLARLAGGERVTVQTDRDGIPADCVSVVAAGVEVCIPLAELVDVQKELARMEKEKKNIENEIARAEGKLNNPGFMSKAPELVVNEERAKVAGHKENMEKVIERIAALNKLVVG